MFLTLPSEIIGKDGKVEGLKCVRMDLGQPDASGRRSPIPVPGSEFTIPCDMVITAIGQKKHNQMMDALSKYGIKDIKGYIAVDFETCRTIHPKIFAGGDCIRSHGEASTVMAVQDGKIAAKAIHRQLVGEVEEKTEHAKTGCCAAASAH